MRMFIVIFLRAVTGRAAFDHVFELSRQAAGAERLEQVGVASGRQRLGFGKSFRKRGDRDDVDVARFRVGLEQAGQREAVHAGQDQIQQNDLRFVLL